MKIKNISYHTNISINKICINSIMIFKNNMLELPQSILMVFDKIKFFDITNRDGELEIDDVIIKYLYMTEGSEGKIYDITFTYQNITYNKLVVKITKFHQTEYNILKFCSDSVKKGSVSNFLKLYAHKCIASKCVYLMEKADDSLENWFKYPQSTSAWKSFMIQILFALDFLSNNNICHGDLKPKNILYTKYDKEIKVKYKSYIFSTDIIFYIVDFGSSESTILGKDRLTDIEINLCTQNHTDFYYIGGIPNKLKMKYLTRWYSLDSLISYIKSQNDKNIDSYVNNKKNSLNNINIPKHHKKANLYRAVAYYALEHYDIDLHINKSNDIKVQLPPKEIEKLFINVFSSKDKIDTILTTHFSNNLH